jgi:CheY-like chemotaxis protein
MFWANVVITALFGEDGTHLGFAKVTRDLTDRRRMERAEADAQTMSEFVAMLAHELRNPLAPIRSAIGVARHAQADATRQRWAIEVIDRQSAHLSRLVDDLLDVSRIARGQVRLERRRMRLGEALDAALEAVQPLASQRGHALTVHRGGDPCVRGDPVRVAQVLTNLLTNACKYTPSPGRIDVRLGTTAGRASVSVADNGEGIAPDLLPRIFDIFTQDKRSLDRAEGGLGLGLAIARQLADLHGGTLSARSAGRGCGSEFVFEMPEVQGTGAEADALTVLVVDDNADAASMLQALVELDGHRCLVAHEGESALATARSALPDLVLLDIGLPGIDGYQVARRLRAIAGLEGVRIAAVTGYASEDDRQRALDAGFDVHLSKPVSHAQLLERLPMLAARGHRGAAGGTPA